MKRPFTRYNILIYYLDFLLFLLIISTDFEIDTLFLGVYFIVIGFLSSRFNPYYKFETRLWVVFINYYCAALSFTFFISILHNDQTNFPSLMMVFYLPIIYKISLRSCRQQDERYFNILAEIFKENKTLKLTEVDRVIRHSFFQDLKICKISDKNSIDIFSLIIEKDKDLQQKKSPLADILVGLSSNWKGLLDQSEDGFKLEDTILLIMKYQIQKIQLNCKSFSNTIITLVYLFEIMENKRSYLQEFYIYRKKKLTLKEQQILYSIHLNFLKSQEV